MVREAENLLAGHGERPDGVNCMERACTWTGIRMSTLTDKSTPHMAGLLIQGNTMGVIELTKARADCEGAQASAQDLAARLLSLEQENIERSLALLEQAEALTTA